MQHKIEKIKIAHLLPERSAHQDGHFLQSWPHSQNRNFENGVIGKMSKL